MSVEKKVPEIRFKGFSGEWEEKAISDLFTVTRGNVLAATKTSPIPTSEKRYPVYSSQTKNNGLMGFYDKYLFENAITWTTDGANAGTVNYREDKFYSTNVNGVLLSGEGYANKAVAEILNKEAWKHVSHVGNPKLMNNVMSAIKITVPNSAEEQTAIGNTFQKLDSLINHRQQKHDQLNNIKKSMLEKMFPKQGETTPEIRFKGFSGEWELAPFGACFTNIPNNTLSRANLNYEDGIAKNIHYGDVLIKFDEVLDASNEILPFITSEEVVNKLKHAALRDGDIIIADAAEDSTVGKCTELFNVGEQLVLSGLHTIAVRPALSFSSKYLGYYLNSPSYHDQLLSLMQGTKVLSISKTALQNTNLIFPNCSKEQTAIGNYFQKLDTLISQHQNQITKLNNIKQACLRKMFI